ncbi:hypothetical protein NECID01_0042 [Nematocida sp. AWRm77]|nr:hypothetical protein NECID01_0042 [Nematocida sp. AWRm77]
MKSTRASFVCLCGMLFLWAAHAQGRMALDTPIPEDLDTYNIHRDNSPGLRNPDAFLSVIDKMISKFPNFKSRMYMLMKKRLDPSSQLFSSNPSTLLGDGAPVPSPVSIYMEFKSIMDADQMLKEDMKKLVRKTQRLIDLQKIYKKNLFENIVDLERDITDLVNRKKRSTDSLSANDISATLARRYEQVNTYLKSYNHAEEWDKDLNHRLEGLLS